jgi:Tol biopolymer transport system component
MRQQHRLPFGIIVLVPITLGLGLVAFTWPRQVPPPDLGVTPMAVAPTATAAGEATAEPAPTGPGATPVLPPVWPLSPPAGDGSPVYEATPVSAPFADVTPVSPPIAVVTPIVEHGAFHDGAWVRVVTDDGSCLNARSGPVLTGDYVTVNDCVPDGTGGVIAGTPVEQDGHWWWTLAGRGWIVEDYLQYVRDFVGRGPLPRGDTLPAGAAGMIAYVRDDQIRTIDLNTGNEGAIAQLERTHDPLYAGDGGYIITPTDLQWSPDGTMLSYNVARQPDGLSEEGWPVDLHIMGRDGSIVRVVEGVAGRGWSPDGTRIGVVIGAHQQGMGSGWNGVPAILDVAAGDMTRLDAEPFFQQDPPSFSHDGTLVLTSRNESITADDGTVNSVQSFVVTDLAGDIVARLTQPRNSYYGTPQWSPAANRFAFYETVYDGTASTEAYVVYDVATRAVVARSPLPLFNLYGGGGCGGGGDMYRASWSPDGSTLYYTAMWRVAGMSGVWAWDVDTDAKRVVPAPYVVGPAAGLEALVAFSSDGYLFVADAVTGARTLLVKGTMPAWSASAH